MTRVLVENFPELRPAYERELSRWGEEMGQHVMYRYILFDAIVDLCRKSPPDADDRLRRLFAFLETLCVHPDANVQEVAHNSVCEHICGAPEVLQRSRPYMRPATREFCREIRALTPMETEALRLLLAGESEPLAVLREQAKTAEAKSREFTGAGFFTKIAVSDSAPRLAPKTVLRLKDAVGTARNLKHGFGLVLFVDDGALDTLEGFTYDEPWPERLQEPKLAHSKIQRRERS
jgi:hypothetical protein